jgi:hypothetical protein
MAWLCLLSIAGDFQGASTPIEFLDFPAVAVGKQGFSRALEPYRCISELLEKVLDYQGRM